MIFRDFLIYSDDFYLIAEPGYVLMCQVLKCSFKNSLVEKRKNSTRN